MWRFVTFFDYYFFFLFYFSSSSSACVLVLLLCNLILKSSRALFSFSELVLFLMFYLFLFFLFHFFIIFSDCLLCNRKLWWREDRDVKEYKKALWKRNELDPVFLSVSYYIIIIFITFFELLKLACICRKNDFWKTFFLLFAIGEMLYWNLGFSDVCIYYYYYNSFVIKSYLLNERKGFSESLQKGFEFLKLVIFYCCYYRIRRTHWKFFVTDNSAKKRGEGIKEVYVLQK